MFFPGIWTFEVFVERRRFDSSYARSVIVAVRTPVNGLANLIGRVGRVVVTAIFCCRFAGGTRYN